MQKKNKRKMLRKNNRIKFCWLIILMTVFSSCRKKSPQSVYTFEDNQSSILSIVRTGYYYKDYTIFKIQVPHLMYRGFFNSGYFAIKDNYIYDVFLVQSCIETYQKGIYQINPIRYSNEISDCDIFFRAAFSTKVTINDTISEINQEVDWTILKDKFYNTDIQDTVYLFEKKIGLNQYLGFTFSNKRGFIGLFEMKYNEKKEITVLERAFGNIYEEKWKYLYPTIERIIYDTRIHKKFIEIDLSLIKEFKNEKL